MTEQEIAAELLRLTEAYKAADAAMGPPYGEPGTVADLRRPYGATVDTPNIDATMFPGSKENRGRSTATGR